MTLEMSTPCTSAFDGDDWLFTVDWDGSRCLLVIDGDGTARLQGENAVLDSRFPEIVAAAGLRGGRAAVLDGTICVLDDQGRPDLESLCRRVAARVSRPQAAYLATDLLHLDGEPLIRRPLLARLAILADLIGTDSRLQLPDHVAGHGRALAAAAAARRLPAMLARRHDAPYRTGVASPERLRVALSDRREAVVVGWQGTAPLVRVVLGDWVDGHLSLVGTARVEDPLVGRWLLGVAETAEVAVEDSALAGEGTTWLRPRLVASIRSGAGDAPTSAEVVLVALRDDIDPAWCVRRRPVDPPQVSSRRPLRPFSPTVLSALPLA